MYLGIDLGTGGCKAALYNGKYFLAAVEYKTYCSGNREVEQDPEEWWQAVVKAVRRVILDASCSPGEIKGIALSGHSPSLVPVGKDGMPLARAIIWQDTRAENEAVFLSSLAGWKQFPSSFEPKMLWFKNHQPEIYKKTSYFLQPKDYIAYKLCRRFQIDSVSASSWFCFDRSKRKWIHIPGGPDLEKLPEITDPWDIIGELTSDASQTLGLIPGIPIISGSIDAYCEALGAGVVDEGQTCDMTGTSTCLLACIKKEKSIRDNVYPHVVPGYHLKILTMSCTGGSLKWFVDTFNTGKAKYNSFEDFLNALIHDTTPGAKGLVFLPYLCGERSPIWDPSAEGVFFGVLKEHSLPDFLQAVLEGVAFGTRQNIENIENDGIKINRIHAVGGAARIDHWLQVKSDIIGKPIYTLNVNEGALVGDVFLAAYATGNYSSLREVVERMLTYGRCFYPRKRYSEIYDCLYDIYLNLYPKIKELFLAKSNLKGKW